MDFLKRLIYPIYIFVVTYWALIKWYFWKKNNNIIRIIIGASKTNYKGWFKTEQYLLDLTQHADFERMFSQKKIDYILAEHVLEHLSNQDIQKMLKNLYEYSAANVNIRIAVPDGYHKDVNYIDMVKPGGYGGGAHDHKNLFTYKTLSKIFEDAGFKAKPVEYWDENHTFHQGYTNDDKGYIKRSFINDSRNKSGSPVYTSLIIDFTK